VIPERIIFVSQSITVHTAKTIYPTAVTHLYLRPQIMNHPVKTQCYIHSDVYAIVINLISHIYGKV